MSFVVSQCRQRFSVGGGGMIPSRTSSVLWSSTDSVVGDAEEQEIFDSASFVLPDLIEARSTRSQHVA